MWGSESILPASQSDATLSDQELFGNDRLHGHCGVSGVQAPGEDVSRPTYFSLYTLQHRDQQSVGIVTSNGKQVLVYENQDLVSQVFSEQSLQGLRDHITLGHIHYAAIGADVWRNAQPMLGPTPTDMLALTHNSNLTNMAELRELAVEIADSDEDFERGTSTDISLMATLLGMAGRIPGPIPSVAPPPVTSSETDEDEAASASPPAEDLKLAPSVDAVLKVPSCIKDAFSLVFMDKNVLYAAYDPHGYRSLMLDRLAPDQTAASEIATLDLCGVIPVREVEPGELVLVDASGVHSHRFAARRSNTCVFKYVYLAHPDTMIDERRIVAMRHEISVTLARKNPIEASLVIPMPDLGTPVVIGYTQKSGIPFAQDLVKNAYVGRAFIRSTQSLRQLGIRLKLNPLREVIEGKRPTVIDNSITCSNTQRAPVKMLYEAGAIEMHIRISSPPVLWSRFFGIDFPMHAKLIASSMSVEQVRESIGADSLAYLSICGMVGTTGQGTSLHIGRFTGEYPEAIPAGVPVPGTLDATPC